MTTIADLTREYDIQPHELADLLDLGADYDETAEITTEDEAFYRDILEHTDESGVYTAETLS